MIRRIVGVLGLLIVVVGLAEIVFLDWARGFAQSFAQPVWLRLTGMVGVAAGVVFVIASAKRLVGLRLFVLILGIYAIVAGLVIFASPDFGRDLMDALLLKRSAESQLTILWASGLARIAIGCALIYAFARPPRPTA